MYGIGEQQGRSVTPGWLRLGAGVVIVSELARPKLETLLLW